jgi:hypothetical protein
MEKDEEVKNEKIKEIDSDEEKFKNIKVDNTEELNNEEKNGKIIIS